MISMHSISQSTVGCGWEKLNSFTIVLKFTSYDINRAAVPRMSQLVVRLFVT